MNDAEIKERLRDRNPWWRDPTDWWRTDRVLRDAAEAPFEYAPDVLAGIAAPSLYTVVGPRRVGKSVCMRRKIREVLDSGLADPRSVIYCSCDGFRAQDLRRMFKAGRALTPGGDETRRWWFVDEISKVDGWSDVVKDLRDDTALRQDCVVLTGSSSRGLRDAVDNLAGRRGPDSATSDRLLMPMGFREFCSLTGVDAPYEIPRIRLSELFSPAARDAFQELSFWTEPLVDAWENYLRIGGFPRAVADYISAGDVSETFVHDIWQVISGDAIRRANLSDATILALLERLGDGLASPTNASDIARDVGLVDNHATNARIDDLAVNFLAWRCPQKISGSASETAQKKVYFADPLLARIARLVDGRREPAVSKMSEQQIGLTLARAINGDQPGSFARATRLMYERTKTKKEIDFVGPDIDGCVEGKYTDHGWKSEAQTARANYDRGILATRRDQDLDSGTIWAVPAPSVAWVLTDTPSGIAQPAR
jgi:predicted AAA+ superfamily ATPase